MKCASRNVPNITFEYYTENSDGLLYSEIQVIMILGIQQSVPFAVNTCPETLIVGNRLPKEMDGCVRKFN